MRLIIASRGVAGKILNSTNVDVTHIVSIGASEPKQRPPKAFDKYIAEKLRLEFFDISCEKRDGMNGPSKKDIITLINFYKEALKQDNPSFLIHCLAGKSRSTAAGLILLKMIYNDDNKARKELFKLVPKASPNTRMLNLAEEILGGMEESGRPRLPVT